MLGGALSLGLGRGGLLLLLLLLLVGGRAARADLDGLRDEFEYLKRVRVLGGGGGYAKGVAKGQDDLLPLATIF